MGGMAAFVLPFFLLILSTSHSFAMTSESYAIPSGVLSGGGTVDASSDNYKLQDVSAQPGTIGTEESGSYKVEGGFIYTVPVIAEIPGVPSIESVDPNVGTRGATADITIYGSNTHFSTTSEALFYGLGMTGITVAATDYYTTIEVVAHITIEVTASLGAWSVHVQTGDELVTLEACFYVVETLDTEPPHISNVKFNGRRYHFGDIISPIPKISATITDESLSISSLEVVIDEGTPQEKVLPNVFKSYTYPYLLDYTVSIEDKISKGIHTIKIKATDFFDNQGTKECQVRVMVGPVQVVGPVLSYPAVFKPLTGTEGERTATLAYTLSTDADITIYMYDISGQVIKTWKFFTGEEGGRAGYNGITWNGITDFDFVVANGIYVYKIVSGNKAIGTGKMVVLD